MFPNHDGKTNKLIVIHLSLLIISIYLISYSFIWTEYFIHRFEDTKSLVDNLDLSISNPKSNGVIGIDGKIYSFHGLGWPVFAMPFYLIGKYTCLNPEVLVSLMALLVSGATVLLVLLFCSFLGYSKRSSLAAAIFYGLGSIAWPYAKHPSDHIIETLFVLLSVYLMYIYILQKKPYFLIFSALSIGYALNTRLTSSLILPALYFMIIWEYIDNRTMPGSLKKLISDTAIFSITLLPFAGFILWYNHYRFGSVFETGYQLVAARTGIKFFTGTPLLTGLFGLLISPGKGIFFYSPVVVFFFFSIIPFYKKHPVPAIIFIYIILSTLLFISKNIYWHGDWAWGPRFVFAITPFLIIPAANLFDSDGWAKTVPRKFFIYTVFVIGLVVQISAISVHPYSHFYRLQTEEHINFQTVSGEGIAFISEPPDYIYFDWNRSPILGQFRYIIQIAKNIDSYEYKEMPETEEFAENIKHYPLMNVFDFWWAYNYYIYNSNKGIIGSILLLLIVIISGFRLIKLSQTKTFTDTLGVSCLNL
jgi:hypothetical protein